MWSTTSKLLRGIHSRQRAVSGFLLGPKSTSIPLSTQHNLKHKEEPHEGSGSKFAWMGVAFGFFGAYYFFKKKNIQNAYAATPFNARYHKPNDKNVMRGDRLKYNIFPSVIADVKTSVVSIHRNAQKETNQSFNQNCIGSGFFVKSDGIILTNYHVVVGASDLKVSLSNGKTFQAEVVAVDKPRDIAAIRISDPSFNKNEIRPLKLGRYDEAQIGEYVIAIGSPKYLMNTATMGIVSNKPAKLNSKAVNYIQTDASIDSGNSGGPLVNLDREVIGMNSWKMGHSGISFAISSDDLEQFLQRLQKEQKLFRKVHRYIGLQMIECTDGVVKHFIEKNIALAHITHGVCIVKVKKGSPAEFSGLQDFDVIVSVNGKPVHLCSDITDCLETTHRVTFEVIRGREKLELSLVAEDLVH